MSKSSLQKGANPTLKKSESLFYKDLVALVASDKSLRAKERRASEFPALAWGEHCIIDCLLYSLTQY